MNSLQIQTEKNKNKITIQIWWFKIQCEIKKCKLFDAKKCLKNIESECFVVFGKNNFSKIFVNICHQTENFVKNVSLELISAHFRRLKKKNKNTTVVINRSRRYHTQCCSRHHLRSHLHRRRRRCRLLQAVDGNILWKRKKSFNKWQIPSLFETLRCRKNILVKDILKMCHRVNFFFTKIR